MALAVVEIQTMAFAVVESQATALGAVESQATALGAVESQAMALWAVESQATALGAVASQVTALAAESQVTALALWGGNHCPLLRQSVPCLSRQRRYALARRVQPILRGGSTCRSIPVQHRAFQRIRLQQQLDQRQLAKISPVLGAVTTP